MKNFFKLLPILALAGCATQEKIIEVKVPIAMPCSATIPVLPAYTFETLAKSDDLYTKVRALLADRQLSKAYETELLATISSCK